MSVKMSWEQKRALHSWGKIKMMMNKDTKTADEYASYVQSLPTAVLVNGLGQAVAQLLAAAKNRIDDPHFLLYEHLQEWLCQKERQSPYDGEEKLLDCIIQGERKKYIQAVHESLAWLNWHKKLAVAHLKVKE